MQIYFMEISQTFLYLEPGISLPLNTDVYIVSFRIMQKTRS
jgi:hypothetical protein